MANHLLTDSIASTTRFLDTSFELAVEQEILLADYDKAVFKIVKTCVDHTITQKYINGNKLICEGYFRISIFYQPPQEEKLTVITKKQPFRHQMDLRQPVQPPYFIPVTGRLQYVNTRAVSSTRISVSGVYGFGVKVYRQQHSSIITAISSPSACCDSEPLSYFTLSASGLRQFSMEDELSLPQNVEKILNITPAATNYTINTYQDKVNVKGEVAVDISYTTDNSPQVSHTAKTFMYNQVVDMPGMAENNAAYADFSIVSFTVTANPDTGKTNCILMANLDVKAFRQENAIIVNDCFSKSFEYEKSHKKLLCDTNITAVSRTLSFQVEDTAGGDYTPVYTLLNSTAPVISTREGNPVLKTNVSVSVIAKNENGEFECLTKTGDIVLETGAELGPDDDAVITCYPYRRDVSISGDQMKARFNIDLKGFVIRHKSDDVLSDFSEDETAPVTNPQDALILYYGEKGENVFDISMRYKTDLSVIMSENNLESKILTEEKMLLIPAYRQ